MVELLCLDFLVEVVVVLRAVGGGGGCGLWWLWISGFAVGGDGAGFRGFEEQKRRKEKNTLVAAIIFCVVTV